MVAADRVAVAVAAGDEHGQTGPGHLQAGAGYPTRPCTPWKP